MSVEDQRIQEMLREGWRNLRVVDSQGRLVNLADFLASEAGMLSRLGRGYRAYWAGTVPAGGTVDIIVLPPVGTHIIGISRDFVVFDGRLDVTFMVGGTYTTTTGSPLKGYNFDEMLENRSESELLHVTDLSGASPRTSGAPVISPSTGPVRAPSAQTAAGAHPRFDATRFPVFRHSNPGAEPVSLWLDIIWEEVGSNG